MAKSMANSMAIARLISEAKSRKSLEIVEDDKTSYIKKCGSLLENGRFGGVGVASEVCAFDAMEEVHENVTGLQVVFILGWGYVSCLPENRLQVHCVFTEGSWFCRGRGGGGGGERGGGGGNLIKIYE